MKISEMKLADLVPNENNPRIHSQKQIEKLAEAMLEFGFLIPVLIDEKNIIISGHGRVLAAELAGIKKIPTVEVSNLTDAQKKAFTIADNKLSEGSEWDYGILKEDFLFLNDIGLDLKLTGFEENEFNTLMGNFDFNPNMEPTTGGKTVTDDDVNRTQDKLSGDMENSQSQKLTDVTCPECGKDFSINVAEL
jgi:ParB-like chromosome segregation protein Spo0J